MTNVTKLFLIGCMGSTKVDALIEASGYRVQEEGGLYYTNGYTFKSYPRLGHHIVGEINGLLLRNDLVNVDALKRSKCSRGYDNFKLEIGGEII